MTEPRPPWPRPSRSRSTPSTVTTTATTRRGLKSGNHGTTRRRDLWTEGGWSIGTEEEVGEGTTKGATDTEILILLNLTKLQKASLNQKYTILYIVFKSMCEIPPQCRLVWEAKPMIYYFDYFPHIWPERTAANPTNLETHPRCILGRAPLPGEAETRCGRGKCR